MSDIANTKESSVEKAFYTVKETFQKAPRVALLAGTTGLSAVMAACGGGGAAGTGTNPPPANTDTPVFTQSGTTLTISDGTSGAQIYYTATNGKTGTTPTTSSTLYSGPITIPTGTTTYEAIAVASNNTSAVTAPDTITINPTNPTAATPTFSIADGLLTISDATNGATISYTATTGTVGVAPTSSNSTPYTAPIPLTPGSVVTYEAIASGANLTTSAVGTDTVNTPANVAATPTFSTDSKGNIVISTATTASGTQILYTSTPGSTGVAPTTANATVYSAPIAPPAAGQTVTIEAITTVPGNSAYTNSSVGVDTVTTPVQAVAGIESGMVSFVNSIGTQSGGTAVTLTIYGKVQGAAQNGTMGGNNVVPVPNPDNSSDGTFGYAAAAVGSGYTTTTSSSVTKGYFVLDLNPTDGSSTAKLYANTDTTTVNTSAYTAVPTITPTNAKALSFTKNTDGSYPAAKLFDTDNGLFAVTNNSTTGYFIPRSGATLGTPVELSNIPTGAGNVSNAWVDSNKNVGVVWGTGASAVLNMYDSSGNWLLSASGPSATGLVSPNAANGTALNPVSVSANVADSLNVSPTLTQNIALYYAQQTTANGSTNPNLGVLYVQPAPTEGAQPVVNQSSVSTNVSNPIIIAGNQTSPGIAPSVGVVNGSTLFSYNVTPIAGNSNAEALSFTEAGAAVLPFSSGIVLAGSPSAYFAGSSSTSQNGVSMVPQTSGGGLGAVKSISSNGSGFTSIVTDVSGNPVFVNAGGAAGFSSTGAYIGNQVITSSPYGASTTSISPVSSSNTSTTGDSSAAAVKKVSLNTFTGGAEGLTKAKPLAVTAQATPVITPRISVASDEQLIVAAYRGLPSREERPAALNAA